MSVALKTVCHFKIRRSFLREARFDIKYVHIKTYSVRCVSNGNSKHVCCYRLWILVFVSATRVRNKKNTMKGRKSMGSCTKGHEEGANRKR